MLILIIVIVIFIRIVLKISNNFNKLQLSVKKTKESFEGQVFEIFKVKTKGTIVNNRSNYNAIFTVQLYDITDGKREPIITTIEENRAKDSIFYEHLSEPFVVPYKESLYNNWTQITAILLGALEFPNKGNRKLEIILEVYEITNTDVKKLHSLSEKIEYFNPKKGYLDVLEDRKKIEEISLKTATIIGNSDGNLDYEELEVIKKWIQDRVKNYNYGFEYQTKLYNKLDKLSENIYYVENDYSYLEEVNSYADESEKYDIFKLSLNVVSGDGIAKKQEIEALKKIAIALKLDSKRCQIMMEKIIPVDIYEKHSTTPKEMVGVTDSMSREEAKKHLMKEYRKWNGRVSHPDLKIREQAEKMIHIIAELRKEYR